MLFAIIARAFKKSTVFFKFFPSDEKLLQTAFYAAFPRSNHSECQSNSRSFVINIPPSSRHYKTWVVKVIPAQCKHFWLLQCSIHLFWNKIDGEKGTFVPSLPARQAIVTCYAMTQYNERRATTLIWFDTTCSHVHLKLEQKATRNNNKVVFRPASTVCSRVKMLNSLSTKRAGVNMSWSMSNFWLTWRFKIGHRQQARLFRTSSLNECE